MTDVTAREGPGRRGTGARWEAASGWLAVALSAAGVAFERPWPSTDDPGGFPEFLAGNRGAIIAQSVVFILSAAVFLWFLAVLRSHLIEAEGGSGRLSTLAFGAGVMGYGLGIVGQAPQITLTLPSQDGITPQAAALLTDLGYTMITVANLPIAVMFAAIGVVSLRTGAFPVWLGWLAVAAAGSSLALALAVVNPTGPLGAQGWLVYLLYPVALVWLVSAPAVMLRRVRD